MTVKFALVPLMFLRECVCMCKCVCLRARARVLMNEEHGCLFQVLQYAMFFATVGRVYGCS